MPDLYDAVAAAALAPAARSEARHRFEHRFQGLALPAAAAAFDRALDHEPAHVLEDALVGVLCRLGGYAGTASLDALLPGEDVALARAHLGRVLANRPDVCVLRLETRAGTIRWVGLLTRPVWDAAARRVVHVYGLVFDLSRCPHRECALHARAA